MIETLFRYSIWILMMISLPFLLISIFVLAYQYYSIWQIGAEYELEVTELKDIPVDASYLGEMPEAPIINDEYYYGLKQNERFIIYKFNRPLSPGTRQRFLVLENKIYLGDQDMSPIELFVASARSDIFGWTSIIFAVLMIFYAPVLTVKLIKRRRAFIAHGPVALL